MKALAEMYIFLSQFPVYSVLVKYQHYLGLASVMRAVKTFHAYLLILMTQIQPATIVVTSALNIIKLDKLFIFSYSFANCYLEVHG